MEELAAGSREASREHRLPGPGRTHEEDVVRPGSGKLERATATLLTATSARSGRRTLDRTLGDVERAAPRLAGRRLPLQMRTPSLDAGQRRLVRGLGGAQDTLQTCAGGALCGRDRPGDGPDPPVENEFAHACMRGQPIAWKLFRGCEHRERRSQGRFRAPSLRSAAAQDHMITFPATRATPSGRRFGRGASPRDTPDRRARRLRTTAVGFDTGKGASTSTRRGSRPTRANASPRWRAPSRVHELSQ